ncbi:MAG: Dihydroanticapsin 7-dehydrogenase [Syntrophomonadaceae bacterium]|nr:Dihydroanticapsin 7-dehydrogenase [Bacillota bacterium]
MPDNKVIIITGGASGIGRATAMLFAQRGWQVAILDKDQPGGSFVAAEIVCHGGQAVMITADVAQEECVRNAIAQALAHFGHIDAAFNNAGILGPEGSIEGLEVEHWSLVWNTNVLGTFLVCKYLIPHLKAQRAGVIINNASIVALSGASRFPAYSASKGAIISLTKSMARALAPYRIRVNCVCPGSIIGTNLLTREGGQSLTKQEMLALLAKIPLGRIGYPADVASAVYFLTSDDAAHITGAILEVDGGELWGR